MLATALNDELTTDSALPAGVKGADLSRWQASVDVGAYTSPFVILKAGGSDDGRYIDADWASRSAAFRRKGTKLGGYWFNGGGSSRLDADYLVSHAAFASGETAIADIEGESGVRGTPWSPSRADDWADEMKGKAPHVRLLAYMSASLTREQDWSGLVKRGVGLYVASYGANTGQMPSGAPVIGCWPHWTGWQYTSVGSIAGVAGHVDLDYFVSSWFSSPSPAPSKVVYIVKDGDTLSSIAARFHTTWEKVYAANRTVIGSNPNLIRAGEHLVIPA